MKNWTDKRENILNTALPTATKSYGVIPHSVFLEEIQEELYKQNYTIAEERYLTADNNKILSGFFRIQDFTDMELMPSISFVNSYNKTRKASIRVAGTVLVCKNGMLGSTPGGSYTRKHIGINALPDFRKHLSIGISGLISEFERLLKNKQEMKDIQIDKSIIARLVGDMIINEDLITTTQLSILKHEINFSANFKGNTLWDFYNNTTESFKDTHPSFYDKQHIKFHSFITSKFDLSGNKGIYGKKLELV